MKRFITFGSIGQYDSVVRDIKHMTNYKGKDAEGNAIYEDCIQPKVIGLATEKIHGTNAAVCYSNPDGFWAQSRKHIITPDKDNAACAFESYKAKDDWMEIIAELAFVNKINLDTHIISVFYEWAGGNIQAHSALTGKEKTAIIFQYFKVSPIDPDEDEASIWVETAGTIGFVDNPTAGIHNIMNHTTWEFEIDFNEPKMAVNSMLDVVLNEIEPQSPIGKEFGFDSNVGEGMVVTFLHAGQVYRFKVKGDKHSKSKVKKLARVDEKVVQDAIDFANKTVTPGRLEQAWQTVFGIAEENEVPSKKFTGAIIKAVMADIVKEELHLLGEYGLEPKQVAGNISLMTKNWFFEQLNERMWTVLKSLLEKSNFS